MEKPLQMLLWGGFAVGVMTFGFFPTMWTVTQAGTARTVVGNAGLAQTLWGGQSGYQGPTVPSALSASVQYPQSTSVAIIPGALTPSITTLTWGTSTWPPTLTIQGTGFGNPVSTGETVTVADTTRGWTATGVVQSFTNTQIVLASFTPTYGGGDPQNWADGLGSFVFAPGDGLTVSVTNPETGQTGSSQAQAPTNMPLPSVTLSSLSSQILTYGQSVTVSGSVTFDGQPLANQAVNLSAPAGTFSGAGGTQATSGDFMIFTDSTGHFTASYTAPRTAGSQTLSAMAGSVTTTETAQVVAPPKITGVTWNTGTWPPQMTVAGSGLGGTGIVDVIENASGQGAVWDNNPNTSDNKLQVSSWSDTGISAGNFASYGAASGFYFAPGEAVGITVTNGQTGQSASYTATYPANAPMPTVAISSIAAINTGQSTVVTGHVSFGATGLANQQVTLTASGGTLGASTVQTDANGNFSATYTAGNTGGTYTVTASSDTGSASANVTINNPPQITGVSFNTGTWPPQLTITGTNLGASSGNVELLDQTRSAWWDNTGQTGPAMTPANAGADGMSATWSDTSIGLSGYGGYGQNVGWHDYLTPGDSIEVFVQTSNGQTASYTATYPANAPMPSVQFSSMPSIQAGQTVTISGSVTFGGQGLTNVPVTVTASVGSFPNGATVVTNGSGDFSIAYTAPTSAGSVTFTASAFTSQTTQSDSISPPSVTVNGMSSIQEGQSETVSGSVTTAGGAGLANVAVNLTTNGGSVSPTTVYTNGSGQWSSTYTAPGSAGAYTVWAQSGGATAGSNVSVTAPPEITSVTWYTGTAANPIWPPQVTINGTGFGSASSSEYVQLVDNTRGWQGGTSGSSVIFTVPTWNNNQIVISGMSNYGGVVFDPGDSVTVNVTNPQTGQTGSFSTTVPNLPMPAISLQRSPGGSVNPGTSVQISGTATFGGQPAADQFITLGITAGMLCDPNGTCTYPPLPPIGDYTNSAGNFTATFTVSNNSSPTSHTEEMWVNYGGASASVQVLVNP